jgi:hypothetical protein
MAVLGRIGKKEMTIPEGLCEFKVLKDRVTMHDLSKRLNHFLQLQVRVLLLT